MYNTIIQEKESTNKSTSVFDKSAGNWTINGISCGGGKRSFDQPVSKRKNFYVGVKAEYI